MGRLVALVVLLCISEFALAADSIVGRVTVWGWTIDSVVACQGADCSEYLLMHGGVEMHGPQLMQPPIGEAGGGQLDITKAQLCAFLDSRRPTNCDPTNTGFPPLTPLNSGWEPNGCGDSSIKSMMVDAFLAVAGQYTGGSGLDNPAVDVYFSPACDGHDLCYGSAGGKSNCDLAFLTDMINICASSINPACEAIASGYFTAVDQYGSDPYAASVGDLKCAVWYADKKRNKCP